MIKNLYKCKKVNYKYIFILILFLSIFMITSLVGSQQTIDTETAITLSQRAEQELNRENFIEAIRLYKQAIELNTNYVPARVGLAKSYYYLENFDRAKIEIEEARQIDRNSIIVLVWAAKINIKLLNYQEAKKDLDNAFNIDARNYNILMTYGEYYRDLGRYSESIRYFNLASGTNEESVEPLIEIGNTYLILNRSEEAYEAYIEAFERNPRDANANYHLALYFYQFDNYDKALEYVENAVIIEPYSSRYLELNYELLFKKSEWENAENLLKQLVNFSNPKPLYYNDLGIALSKQGKYSESVEYLKQGLERYKGDEILRWRTELEAIEGLKINNPQRKELAVYRYELGLFYKNKNIIDKALFMLEKAIKIDPENLIYRYYKALIYKDLGFNERYYNIINFIYNENPNITNGSVLFRNLDNDLEYYSRKQEDSLSGRLKIDQYSQNPPFTEPRPKIVVSGVEILEDSESYYEANYDFQSMIYRALSLNDKVSVSFLDTRKIRNETDELTKIGADFVVKAKMKEEDNLLTVSIDLQNVHNGVTILEYESSQRGNNRFLNISLDYSQTISENIPVFGRIREKTENEVIVNIGSIQGISKGDILYIIGNESEFRAFIRDNGNFKDNNAIKSYSKAEIEVDIVDERIFKGRIISGDYQNTINENNFAIYPSHLK